MGILGGSDDYRGGLMGKMIIRVEGMGGKWSREEGGGGGGICC